MAKFVFITDEEGVVRVERRPSPLKDAAMTGKKALDIVRDPANAANPITLNVKYSELVGLVAQAEMSDRLSEQEKATIRRVLLEFDPLLDSVEIERRPAEFFRTHGIQAFDLGPGPSPRDTVRTGSFDP